MKIYNKINRLICSFTNEDPKERKERVKKQREIKKAKQKAGKYCWKDCNMPNWISKKFALARDDGRIWYGNTWVYRTYFDSNLLEDGDDHQGLEHYRV